MKCIDAEKLIEGIKHIQSQFPFITYKVLFYLITSLQQDCSNQSECVWVHKKYNREYRIVSDNARLKNSDGEWIDCVIYAPLYENEFEMFAREKDSFYSEFEKVK